MILAILPIIEDKSDFIQSIEASISIGSVLINTILAIMTWGRRPGKESIAFSGHPLGHLMPEDLHIKARGGEVKFIDREIISVQDLYISGRIIIIGDIDVGKTREAYQLLRRALAEDIVRPNIVLTPNPGFLSLTRKDLDKHSFPLLLYLDDFPRRSYFKNLEQLTRILSFFGTQSYVIATARSDQLDEKHLQWLKKEAPQILSF